MSKPRVLIAEDSPVARTILEDTLQSMDLEMTLVENGLNALKLALKEEFDLLVLDIDMPLMRGLQVCRFIKEDPVLRVIPVIMLTGRDTSADKFWGEQSGADRYVTKPYDPESLRQTISEVLDPVMTSGITRTPELEKARRQRSGLDPLVLVAELYETKLMETTIFKRLGEISRMHKELKHTCDGLLKLLAGFSSSSIATIAVTKKMESKIYIHSSEQVTKKFALAVREKAMEEVRRTLRNDEEIETNTLSSEIILLNETAAPWKSGDETQVIESFFSLVGGSGTNIHLLLAMASTKPNAFSQNEIELVQNFMDQAFVAIELAKVNEEMHNQAIRDGLTGLFNHRHFQEVFEKEFQRSRRYNHPLTLVMLDIDHFKKINDTYGHPAGDQVLAGVSRILKNTVRDIDLVARYGGEEFAIVLPQTPPENAHIVAERFRRNIQDHKFYIAGDDPVSVTVSVGMMGLPSDQVETKLDLLSMADEALYYGKQNGRNRTTIWSKEISGSKGGKH